MNSLLRSLEFKMSGNTNQINILQCNLSGKYFYRLNSDYEWKAPQERAENSKEIEVGGIYIRLLIQNPGWQLRRPREFITVLFDKIVELTAPTNGDVDQDLLTSLAEAGCGLFYAQMNLTKMGKSIKF